MEEIVLNLTANIPLKTYNGIKDYITAEMITYRLKEQSISFPYRVYFYEIDDNDISKMDNQQKAVMHCIYSRSCDGFVREKHIKSLLSMNYPDWAIPYIVKVCDEYVVEILQTVYNKLKDANTEEIKRFCMDNMNSFCRSYNRMISYWNEFYRYDCYHYKEYIGRKLFIEYFGASRTMNCTR